MPFHPQGDALAPFIDTIWDDWLRNDPPRADTWLDYDRWRASSSLIRPAISPTAAREAAVQIVKVATELLDTYREAIDGSSTKVACAARS